MKNQAFSNRFKFALNGISHAFKSERSFRFQSIAAIAAVCFLAFLKASPAWWALFSIIIGAVLGAELFNTALECLMDHLHPEQHPAIKLAKDCAAGAVLIFSLISISVFICFLYERFG